MTFDAGALAAFAFSVLSAFVWLIWQGSASNTNQKALSEDFAEHRKEFASHVKYDEEVDRKVVTLINTHDTRLAILEDRRHMERREDERRDSNKGD